VLVPAATYAATIALQYLQVGSWGRAAHELPVWQCRLPAIRMPGARPGLRTSRPRHGDGGGGATGDVSEPRAVQGPRLGSLHRGKWDDCQPPHSVPL